MADVKMAARRSEESMSNPFNLDESKMLNDPRSLVFKQPYIILKLDGKAICAHLDTFQNLQESPAGFGQTSKEAVMDLLQNMKRICRRALWDGFGTPAGICGEPAYTDEIHPNSLAMILCDQVGRCPKHGGFGLEAAAALALYYRTPQEYKDAVADYPHASDCASWVGELCDCVTGKSR